MDDSLPGLPDLLALGIQLVALALVVAGAAAAVGRRLPGLDRPTRAAAVTTLAASYVVLTTQALGFLGLLRPLPAALALLPPLWLIVRPGAQGESFSTPRRDDPPARRIALTLGGLAAAALAWPLLRALLFVPADWDGLSYHLFFPARYLQEGAIFAIEHGRPLDQAALYPQNGELLHAFSMLFLRGDLLVAPVMVLFTALAGVAAAALARALGARPISAVAAGALAATLPPLYSRSASSYVEPLLDFAQIAALLFALLSLRSKERAATLAALAGLAAGLAIGTKYTALGVAAILFVAFAIPAGRRTRLVSFSATVLATGGAWYVRNTILTGNPLFPSPFLGLPHLERSDLAWHGSNLWHQGWALTRSGLLGDVLFALPPATKPSFSLGLALFALLPFAALGAVAELRAAASAARRKDSPAAAALALPVVALVATLATYLAVPFWLKLGFLRSLVRFAVPFAIVAIVLAFVWLSRRVKCDRSLALVAVAALAYHLAISAPSFALGDRWPAAIFLALGMGALTAAVIGVWRIDGARLVALGLAPVLLALVLYPAWTMREKRRSADWSAPSPHATLAEAAQAIEELAPRARTVAFAATDYSEFLHLLVGRRMERRVVALPIAPGPKEAFRWQENEARRAPSRERWLEALAAERVDLLVISRWGSRDGRWPIEQEWAKQLGFERLFANREYQLYRSEGSLMVSPESSGQGRAKPGEANP